MLYEVITIFGIVAADFSQCADRLSPDSDVFMAQQRYPITGRLWVANFSENADGIAHDEPAGVLEIFDQDRAGGRTEADQGTAENFTGLGIVFLSQLRHQIAFNFSSKAQGK